MIILRQKSFSQEQQREFNSKAAKVLRDSYDKRVGLGNKKIGRELLKGDGISERAVNNSINIKATSPLLNNIASLQQHVRDAGNRKLSTFKKLAGNRKSVQQKYDHSGFLKSGEVGSTEDRITTARSIIKSTHSH